MAHNQKTVYATLEAEDSPAPLKNTVNLQAMIYANCGRWQKGNTDFLVVCESEVVLASWGNFNNEASQSSVDGFFNQYNRSNEIKRIKSSKLKEFFKSCPKRNGRHRAWPIEYLSLHIPSLKKENQFKLTNDNELIIIVPDCHITLFKRWAWDEFVMPFHKEDRRRSLARELKAFYSYASGKADEIVQLGDLLDNWHIQWMFELGFDIYSAASSDPSFDNMTERFPIELLSDPERWPKSTPQVTTVYSWWKHLHTYLGVDKNAVRANWNKKVTPCDIMAILFWGLDLDSWSTCLNGDEFDIVRDVLKIHLGGDVPTWHTGVCPGQNGENSTYSQFWKNVKRLKASLGHNAALDFLDYTKTEERIIDNYSSIKTILKTFCNAEGTKYLRGNHDCKEENDYLKKKFVSGYSEEMLKEELKCTPHGELEDPDVKLLPDSKISRLCGERERVCIEHGDAWDLQNNGKNYFKFKVGNPWSDVRKQDLLDYVGSGLAQIFNATHGGYHMPKGSFNEQKLQDKYYKMPKQWLSTKIGDVGLEPPANLRTAGIFWEGDDKANKVALVVMGHTHIRRLQLVSGLFGETANESPE